jgi:hypothetical protein
LTRKGVRHERPQHTRSAEARPLRHLRREQHRRHPINTLHGVPQCGDCKQGALNLVAEDPGTWQFGADGRLRRTTPDPRIEPATTQVAALRDAVTAPDESATAAIDPTPEVVLAIQRYARSVGCDYVLFDRNADCIDELPHLGLVTRGRPVTAATTYPTAVRPTPAT